MKIAHRYHWHYAPPIYPDGDTLLWCKWCGMRDVIKRKFDIVGISGIGELQNQLDIEKAKCDSAVGMGITGLFKRGN